MSIPIIRTVCRRAEAASVEDRGRTQKTTMSLPITRTVCLAGTVPGQRSHAVVAATVGTKHAVAATTEARSDVVLATIQGTSHAVVATMEARSDAALAPMKARRAAVVAAAVEDRDRKP